VTRRSQRAGRGLAAGEDGRGDVVRRLPPWCLKMALRADVSVTHVTVQNGHP